MFSLFRRTENKTAATARKGELETQYRPETVTNADQLIGLANGLCQMVSKHPRAEQRPHGMAMHLVASDHGELVGRSVGVANWGEDNQYLSIQTRHYDPEMPAYNEFYKLVTAYYRDQSVAETLTAYVTEQLRQQGYAEEKIQEIVADGLLSQRSEDEMEISVKWGHSMGGKKQVTIKWEIPPELPRLDKDMPGKGHKVTYEMQLVDNNGFWQTSGNLSTRATGRMATPWFPAPADIAEIIGLITETQKMVQQFPVSPDRGGGER